VIISCGSHELPYAKCPLQEFGLAFKAKLLVRRSGSFSRVVFFDHEGRCHKFADHWQSVVHVLRDMNPWEPWGYTWTVVAVPTLAWMGFVVFTDYSPEYQRFADFFPMTRTCPAPYCTLFYGNQRAAVTPALINHFDWVIGHKGLGHDGHGLPQMRRKEDPMSVFASPDKVPTVLGIAEASFNASRSDRILVISGAPEHTVSEAFGGSSDACTVANATACAVTITRLRAYFRAIFVEGKDLAVEGILAYPGGLTEMYYRGEAMKRALVAITSARNDDASKPRSVLAAWGAVWSYIEQIDHGKMMFFAHGKPEWDQIKLEAGRSRRLARAWAATDVAKEVGVEVRSISAKVWWQELALYRFILSPLGTSIYSPKTVEALMVLTVPIVQRGPFPVHDDMVSYGFPIVVVDDWDNITQVKLSQWWRELSPRVVQFRRNCLNTEGYWRLMTGEKHFCQ